MGRWNALWSFLQMPQSKQQRGCQHPLGSMQDKRLASLLASFCTRLELWQITSSPKTHTRFMPVFQNRAVLQVSTFLMFTIRHYEFFFQSAILLYHGLNSSGAQNPGSTRIFSSYIDHSLFFFISVLFWSDHFFLAENRPTRAHSPIIPNAFKGNWAQGLESVELHAYSVTFETISKDSDYVNFGLFLEADLGPEAGFLEVELHLPSRKQGRRGSSVIAKCSPCGTMVFDRNQASFFTWHNLNSPCL